MRSVAIFLVSLVCAVNSLASVFNSEPADEFLTVEQAYQLQHQGTDNSVQLFWQIAPKHYLYQSKFKVELFTANADGTTYQQESIAIEYSPNIVVEFDPFSNADEAIYFDYAQLDLTLDKHQQGYLRISYQGCAKAGLCYPPVNTSLRLDAVTGDLQPLRDEQQQSADTAIRQAEASSEGVLSLGLAMLFAAIGGLVLNLMPCVFPVLSLKAMQLAQVSDQRAHVHGLVYTLGVVASFLLIALVLMLLRGVGEAVGWGFQLQSPGFVIALIYLFFILALSMAGIYEFGQRLMGVGQGLTEHSGAKGSFFTGVLATLVATPCTAPFMGSAIAAALSQPIWWAALVFGAMGLGMALPILLLTWIPSLHRLLPKPGAWMNHFKQLLSFPLFATVVWLLWVLIQQIGDQGFFLVSIGLVCLGLMAWIKGSEPWQISAKFCAFIFALAFAFSAFLEQFSITQWLPY